MPFNAAPRIAVVLLCLAPQISILFVKTGAQPGTPTRLPDRPHGPNKTSGQGLGGSSRERSVVKQWNPHPLSCLLPFPPLTPTVCPAFWQIAVPWHGSCRALRLQSACSCQTLSPSVPLHFQPYLLPLPIPHLPKALTSLMHAPALHTISLDVEYNYLVLITSQPPHSWLPLSLSIPACYHVIPSSLVFRTTLNMP